MSENQLELEYQTGERVLALSFGLLEDARIIKMDKKGEKNFYYIHYQGRREIWDEWVDSTRLHKWNETNLQVKEELKRQSKNNKILTMKKKKVESDVPIKFQIEMPISLRRRLLEDYDFINNQGMLCALPQNPSVDSILSEFMQEKTDSTTREVILGIREHFDRNLGLSLLYKSERTQYNESLTNFRNSEPSDYYGIDHLLRSLSKYPVVLSLVDIEPHAMEVIQNVILDFYTFLDDHAARYLTITDQAYIPCKG